MDYIKIKKIHLKYFKCFRDATIECNPNLNIIVGDNGTGKSSILQAIDLALSGSITRVEKSGIENILNMSAVSAWKAQPSVEKLPVLTVELFFDNMPDNPKMEFFYGEKYSDNKTKESAFGIKMICEPDPEFFQEISQQLQMGVGIYFPYEYYKVHFSTFSDMAYSQYNKPFHLMYIDNSTINEARALRFVITNTYSSAVSSLQERISKRQEYRNHIELFNLPQAALDKGIFIDTDLEQALNIRYQGIRLNNQGQGTINIHKTDSVLLRNINESAVFLIEEPETHLSHVLLQKMIERIKEQTESRQLFITTHSSYITSRLGLRNAIFVNKTIQSLSSLDDETSRFFMKTPNDNLLQFVLSAKVLLVEGAAEYILLDFFVENITGKNMAQNGIWCIALNNLSFQRYLTLGRLLGIIIAVIRDNDKSTETFYPEYVSENIHVFVDKDPKRYTFEVCLYEDNRDLLKELFAAKPDVLDYMLKNKAEAAFRILNARIPVKVPSYIEEAIRWIVTKR